MTGGHDAGLSHTEAKDQVVPPQGDVAVAGARRAGLLGIYWTAAERQKSGRYETQDHATFTDIWLLDVVFVISIK